MYTSMHNERVLDYNMEEHFISCNLVNYCSKYFCILCPNCENDVIMEYTVHLNMESS